MNPNEPKKLKNPFGLNANTNQPQQIDNNTTNNSNNTINNNKQNLIENKPPQYNKEKVNEPIPSPFPNNNMNKVNNNNTFDQQKTSTTINNNYQVLNSSKNFIRTTLER